MHRLPILAPFSLLLVPLSSGCGWQEDLVIYNLQGTVRIPKAATSRTVFLPPVPPATEPTPVEIVDDPRLIGPVYLGLFPAVEPAGVLERYPHPEVGPQYIPDTPGDTYPYGGTSVGDLQFACFEALACKVTTGRFDTYQSIIDWFAMIGQPLVEPGSGVEVTSGEYIQQVCFDLLAVTSDEEVRLIGDLDFRDAGDSWEAPFTLWQQEFFWNLEEEEQKGCTPGRDCTGFTLWGFMDAPDPTTYQFSTCDATVGINEIRYDVDFYGGAAHLDILNFPSTYITTGDWVVDEPYVWKDIYEEPELVFGFEVE